ncbi:MAG TPA: hypothetical protein VFV83_10640 [Chthoniobacteraceae bacterium]|nr:hypothetical protein [Chthoniobacteraceae bacterium]
MKFILTLIVLVLIALGGMVLLAHHDTAVRANAAYKKLGPVTASFSRFRGDKAHLVSVYWRLHFSRKIDRMPENVAFWSLRPFRHVTLVTK